MGMEQWWNDAQQGKIKASDGKPLLFCHFLYDKFHIDLEVP
jgi:hypothetical protein